LVHSASSQDENVRSTLPPPTWGLSADRQVEKLRGTLSPPAWGYTADGGREKGSTGSVSSEHMFGYDAATSAILPTADYQRQTADELGGTIAAEIEANMEALHQGTSTDDNEDSLLRNSS
jgi:hypothetical protein